MSFSLRTLLVFTAGVAVVFASLKNPAPIVGDLYYTIGLLTIALAVLAAIIIRGPNRAKWIGFVLLFAVYFCHSVWPRELWSRSSIAALSMGVRETESRELITTRAISYLFNVLHPEPGPESQGRAMSREDYEVFLTVGHTAIALLVGLCGVVVARRLAKQASPAIIGEPKETTS